MPIRLESLRRKVQRVLPDRRDLDSYEACRPALHAIAAALNAELGPQRAHDVGFHLVDWASDAAFLVALCLDPKRFTRREIRDGVVMFLVHAPAHVIAAARLAGHSTDDIFLEFDTEPPPPPRRRRTVRRAGKPKRSSARAGGERVSGGRQPG